MQRRVSAQHPRGSGQGTFGAKHRSQNPHPLAQEAATLWNVKPADASAIPQAHQQGHKR